MVIYIGADHRGFNHKEAIKKYLVGLGYEVSDQGNEKYDELDGLMDERIKEDVIKVFEDRYATLSSNIFVTQHNNEKK